MAQSFVDKRSLLAVPPPANKPFIELWHEYERGFGVRIMRAREGKDATRSYLARYKGADGKDTKEVLGRVEDLSFDEARMTAIGRMQQARAVARGEQRAVLTVRAAFNDYISRKELSEQSKHNYRKHAAHVEAHLAQLHTEGRPVEPADRQSIVALNREHWNAFYVWLEQRNGTATVNAVMRLVHAVYARLLLDERVASNPIAAIARDKSIYKPARDARRPIRRDQLPKFWAWLHNSTHPAVRDYMLLAVLTGLRESVLGSLRWENVDMHGRRLLIEHNQRGNKGKVTIWMPLADMVVERILRPRYDAPARGEWVLPSMKKRGQPLHNVNGSFKALREATGIAVSDHDLRSTFGGLAHAVMGKTKTAAQMLTHLSSSMTDDAPAYTGGYIIIEEDDMRIGFNRVAQAFTWYCTNPVSARPPIRALADWDTLDVSATTTVVGYDDSEEREKVLDKLVDEHIKRHPEEPIEGLLY